MSPSRAPVRGYRPPRPRGEVLRAVLGVAAVLVVAVVLIWVLAPDDTTEPEAPVFTPPPVSPEMTLPVEPPTTPSTIPE
jgi:hypothetical protein